MKTKQRVKDIGEVFTPQHIVEQMVDLIPEWDIETTVLEPSCGEGVFLCEILRRKLNTIEALRVTSLQIQIALQSLYGVDIMLDNVLKTRENLIDILSHLPQSLDDNTIADFRRILENNIRWGDTLACFEAKTENVDVICLRDLQESQITDLTFFNYKTKKWEKFISSFDKTMRTEIAQQRNEYRTQPQQAILF